jgi:hypothetical protein
MWTAFSGAGQSTTDGRLMQGLLTSTNAGKAKFAILRQHFRVVRWNRSHA